jgi:hypothetical protein
MGKELRGIFSGPVDIQTIAFREAKGSARKTLGQILICACGAKAKNTSRERGRFIRRHLGHKSPMVQP